MSRALITNAYVMNSGIDMNRANSANRLSMGKVDYFVLRGYAESILILDSYKLSRFRQKS